MEAGDGERTSDDNPSVTASREIGGDTSPYTGEVRAGGEAVSQQNCLRETESCDILRGILACGAWRGRAKEKKERKRRDGAL